VKCTVHLSFNPLLKIVLECEFKMFWEALYTLTTKKKLLKQK
jgi:hypothetical protein